MEIKIYIDKEAKNSEFDILGNLAAILENSYGFYCIAEDITKGKPIIFSNEKKGMKKQITDLTRKRNKLSREISTLKKQTLAK